MPWDEIVYLESYYHLSIGERNEVAWFVRTHRQAPMASYRDPDAEYR